MCKCSTRLSFIHFADDTTVSLQGNNLDILYGDMNRELCAIEIWLNANKLSLNINKTAFMVFSNKIKATNCSIKIRDADIECVKQAKFLGIIIDDRLKFKPHIFSVISRVSKSCGIIRKLSKTLPTIILRKLYFTLVYPFLIYGIECWGSSSLTLRNKLGKLQNKCINFITEDTMNSPNVYSALNILPLTCIYKYFLCVKFFKYCILEENLYFLVKLCSIQINHDVGTRFKRNGLITCPRIHRSACFNSFLYKSISFWNILPPHLKSCSSLPSFKRSLRTFIYNLPMSL